MSDHLPFIHHLAAREAGRTLKEFAALTEAEQQSWMKFALEGPSRFRDTLMIAQIRNMLGAFFGGVKFDDSWLDAVFENPDAAHERKLASAKQSKKAEAVRRAKELHEREKSAIASGVVPHG